MKKSTLDRLLSLFAPVNAGEAAGALLLALNVFLLLASYYILKTVREALILGQGGAEVKSYSAAGQAILLLFVVPLYSSLASRVTRVRLVVGVSAFFALNLAAFAAIGAAGVRVGIPFYLWLGIFNVFVVAQFWAFANDLYTEDQGKRLFPLIGVGSSLGAWLGAASASRWFKFISPYELMIIASIGLVLCIILTVVVNRRAVAEGTGRQRELANKPLGKEGAFKLVMRSPYLRLVALLILVLNVVNSTGEFLLGKLVVAQATASAGAGPQFENARETFIGAFYGSFFGWVNLAGLLIQLFLVSRIFRAIGVRGALFILPFISLSGYTLFALFPVLGIVRIAKILENSTDYSLQNTVRQALYLPTSREAKYKAKAAIDTFFVRIGDMLQAAVVFTGTALAFSVREFAWVNVAIVILWLVITLALYREHKRISPDDTSKEVAG